MDIVALMSLASSVETEAPLLAAELGQAPYETALLLRTPSPVPLLRTEDRARALDLLAKLRARGHDAVACDAASVVSTDAMTHVRSFQFEPDAFVVVPPEGPEQRVAWGDIVTLVRAVHRSRSEHVEKTAERQLSLGRAALSGGLLVSKTITSSKTQSSEHREPVLYVFRRGGKPLFVSQSRVRYDGLGSALRPVQIENFNALVTLLRERASDAPFDDRLVAPRPGLDRVRAGPAGRSSSSSSDGIDLLAHFIALALARAPRPYR